MCRLALTLREEQLSALRRLLFPDTGHEAMAYVLCGQVRCMDPISGQPLERFLARDIIPIPAEDVRASSPTHITVDTRALARVLRLATDSGATVMVVHSHRPGPAEFSLQDDADEPQLVELAQHRNGSDTRLISMIVSEAGPITARVWYGTGSFARVDKVAVVGDRFSLPVITSTTNEHSSEQIFARQILALGPHFQELLGVLRIGIIGAGATGSAVAMLLARLGVNEFVVIDEDIVEDTNLNRLHGATFGDAEQGTPKILVLERHIPSFRPGIKVHGIKSWVGHPDCRDALRTCDVIFSCTDDHDGRLLLNRHAYFYLTPVIDMGIGIDFIDDETPRITDAAARVTTLLPGHRCLLCRGVIDPEIAREEALERSNPEEYRRQKEEAYVRGGGAPSPSVVTYTTEVACMAVDELIQRLTGYRKTGSIAHRVRKYPLATDKTPGLNDSEIICPLCQDSHYWGRGDMTPFLDRMG